MTLIRHMSTSEDRRFQRTRQALQQALLTLINEQPFDQITVQQVIDRADVARKTFYAHYADLHELLWDCLEQFFAETVAALGRADSDTLLLDGKPLSYSIFRHVADHVAFYRLILSAHGSAAVVARLIEFMAQQSYELHAPFRAVAPRITVPPHLIAHHLAGAVVGSIVWWLKQPDPPSPETMAYTFSQLAAPGVMNALGFDE